MKMFRGILQDIKRAILRTNELYDSKIREPWKLFIIIAAMIIPLLALPAALFALYIVLVLVWRIVYMALTEVTGWKDFER